VATRREPPQYPLFYGQNWSLKIENFPTKSSVSNF
jgi:hypothetical protein